MTRRDVRRMIEVIRARECELGIVEGSTEWKHSRIEILSQKVGIAQYADANAAWGRTRDRELKKNIFLPIDRN